eukprot:9810213-Ditylum_brightwellii.AAC.1
MSGRIIDKNCDPSGLGQLSYVKIAGRDQQQVTVVTAYRLCIQHNPGNNTVTAQQIRVMKQNGVNKPKPRTAWLKDIKHHIDEWKQEGDFFRNAEN